MPKLLRRIDQLPAITTGVATVSTADSPAPPALGSIGEPTDLTLTAALLRSAVTPSAIISAVWEPPLSLENPSFALQISEDISFPHDATATYGDIRQPSMAIEGVKTATLYYVRVATIYRGLQSAWTEVVGIDGVDRITTPSDTTPPDEPEDIGWTWTDTGDLLFVWTNGTSANLRDVELRIWSDSGKTTEYTLAYSSAGRYAWTLAEQKRAQSNPAVLDAAVYVELRSRSYGGVFSSAITPTSQPNKPAPSAPAGLTSSWAGEVVGAGVAGADCVLSWTADPIIKRWVLTIDGVSRDVSGNKYIYTQDANAAEHSNTPDPTLSASLVGYDALGQVSPSSSITPTNAVPAAPSSVTIGSGGPSNLVIDIAGATPADFRDYTVRILRDSSLVETLTTTEPFFMRSMTVPGTYQVGVKVNDVFGQPSATETMSSAVVLDFLTIQKLRADTEYSDSAGTAAATLDGLKDGDTTTTVVSYSTNAWSSIQAQRPFLDRSRTISAVAGITGGSLQVYVGLSKDNITYTWYAGPLTGTYSNVMTAVASEAAAQAAAFTPPSTGRLELPAVAEARFVKLGVKGSTGGFLVQMRELYLRRLVQGDDLEIETIQAINIAADAITANKIAAGAITAVHISATAIDGKTITGATIQTGTIGARVVLSSAAAGGLIGYGALDTYNVATGSGTYQVLWKKTDGKLYAGAGAVVLDSNGIGIAGDSFALNLLNLSPVTAVRANAIEWTVGSGQKPSISGSASNGQLLLRGQKITLGIPITSTNNYYGLNLQSNGAHLMTGTSLLVMEADSTAAVAFEVTAGLFASGCSIRTQGGVNVGTATGAAAGQIKASAGADLTSMVRALSAAVPAPANGVGLELFYTTVGPAPSAYIQSYDRNASTAKPLTFLASSYEFNTGYASIGVAPVSSYKLLVQATDSAGATSPLVVRNSSSSNLMYVQSNGGLWANTTWTTSDEKFKEDIRAVERGLADLRQLSLYTYGRKSGRKKEHGVIAQTAREVFPELVETGMDGELGFDYHGLAVVSARATQELADDTEAQFADLKAQFADLKAQFAALGNGNGHGNRA